MKVPCPACEQSFVDFGSRPPNCSHCSGTGEIEKQEETAPKLHDLVNKELGGTTIGTLDLLG